MRRSRLVAGVSFLSHGRPNQRSFDEGAAADGADQDAAGAVFGEDLQVDVQLLSEHGTGGVLVRPVSSSALIEAALVGPAVAEERDTRDQPASPHPAAASWLCRLGDEHRPLPVTFDPAAEHHLRLEKWADRLSMWLDGHPIAEIEVPADPSRFALFTDGAAAAFRDVSFTGLA